MKSKEAADTVEERIEKAVKQNATELDLGRLGITALPESIGKLKSIHTLRLDGNNIKIFPSSLRQLTSLRAIHLTNNNLKSIPIEVFQMPQLKMLDLQSNKLVSIPAEIGRMSGLENLWLNNNLIVEISPEIGQLKRLRELLIWNNKLAEIPSTIIQLQKLITLNLGQNQITRIPEQIGQLSALQELVVSRNRIQSLPESLVQIKPLRGLYLDGNDSLNIPAEVLGTTWQDMIYKGTVAASPKIILEYFFKMLGGSRPLNEAKLILVGRGSVGKTTLVHQLIFDKFSEKTKTKGIKVSQWLIPDLCGDITTHVWDFGGQEIMHGTHQFFLTERSLYLLVLAGREDREDEDAEYWLKTIRAFGGDSPVIIILNKIKDHYFEVDEEGLRAKYPNIVAFIETDCKPMRSRCQGTGITDLRNRVISEVLRMDSVRRAFPSAWFRIKQRLTGMHENFMSFDTFRNICVNNGERHHKDQDELAHYLHLLGVALNYRDDPRLSETSVLNPKWVTTGIYKLLNDSSIKKRRGVLKSSDISRILSAKQYPSEMHDFLLRLMRKFDLCFPLDTDLTEYLIPELLEPIPKP